MARWQRWLRWFNVNDQRIFFRWIWSSKKRALFYFYRHWVNFKLPFPNIFLYLIFISIIKVIFIKNKSFKFVKILHWICFSFFQKKFSLNFFYRLNVEIIRWFNVISTLTSRYDQIETVLINGLNVVVVDTQFNDKIFGSTNLTSTLANPEYFYESNSKSTFFSYINKNPTIILFYKFLLLIFFLLPMA